MRSDERETERQRAVRCDVEWSGVGSARVGDVTTRAEFKGGQSDEDESSRVRRRRGGMAGSPHGCWLHGCTWLWVALHMACRGFAG